MSSVELRYVGAAARFRSRPYDIVAEQGETISVDEETTVTLNDGDEETETELLSLPEWLLRDHDFERVTRQYPILDESIPKLEAKLETGEYDDMLDSLAHAERESENRTGALHAIGERKQTIASGESSGGDEPPDTDDGTDAEDAPESSEA